MKYVLLMRPIIAKAGDLVLAHFRKKIEINYKNDKNIATNVDLMSQNLLKTELLAALPGSGFIAEESKESDIQEFTWVIDPIDGTKNFVRGLPYFCITVALMHNFKVIACVTHNPVTNEWFYAQQGCGAWLNDVRLVQKTAYQDAGALVVVSDYFLRQSQALNDVKRSLASVQQGVRFRVNGAVALDLAYAAAGVFDVVIFQNLAWWDMAAGILLVQEAGGVVCQHDGGPIDQKSQTLIAGDEQLCKMVMAVLQ